MKCSNIGGQALMEGIMMRNGGRYSIAVRKPDREIEIKVENYRGLAESGPLSKIPILRGVVNFVQSLIVGIRSLMYSASFFEDEDGKKPDMDALSDEERRALEKKKEKEEKGYVAGALLLSLVMVVVLFILLPLFMRNLLGKVVASNGWLSVFEALIRVAIFLGYLILISRMKDIQRTFMYHGAEHKCINCVEAGRPLTVDNVLASSRFHKRCGTSFLFFMVIVSAALLMLIQTESRLWRILFRLILIPVIAGISYEILRLAGRTDNRVVDILSKPGLALQRLTTREPDASQAEVAIAAVEAIFDWKQYLRDNYDWEEPPCDEAGEPETDD